MSNNRLKQTPLTDSAAFDLGRGLYANERIQELEAYMSLAKSGLQQLIEYWESKQ